MHSQSTRPDRPAVIAADGVSLLFATGMTILTGFASSVPWIILAFILLYAAVLTAAAGLASKVRPHVLRGDSLLVKWGLHQELAVPLASVRSTGIQRSRRGRDAGPTRDLFAVPGSGRELVVIDLDESVAVPTRLGRQRLAETILLPVDEAHPALAALTTQLAVGRVNAT